MGSTAESSVTSCLVICTRNRPRELAACLTAVVQCSDRPNYVLVVDSSDGEDSHGVVDLARATWPEDETLNYIRSTSGLTRQRNVGLDSCPMDRNVVHFIDDDSLPLPGYFSALESVYVERPECSGVGSAVADVDSEGNFTTHSSRDDHSGPSPLVRRLLLRFGCLTAEPGHFSKAAAGPQVVRAPAGREPLEVQWLSGCAMSFRLPLAKEVRFDEEVFSGYSLGEDREFCLRVSDSGPLLIAPNTCMRHMSTSTNRLNRRQWARMYTVNRYHMVSRNRGRFTRSAYLRSLIIMSVIGLRRREVATLRGILDGLRELRYPSAQSRSSVMPNRGAAQGKHSPD